MSELPIVAPGYEEAYAEPEDLSACLTNRCVIDRSVLTEAMQAAMNRPFFRVLRIIDLAVIAAALGLLVWSLAAKQSVITVLEALFLLGAALFFYVQQFVRYPKQAVKTQITRQALEDGTDALENRLYFTEENVANRRGEGDLILHMPYENITRVSETRRLILLTTRRRRLIPLDKHGFANGGPEELYRLLAVKAPNAKTERRSTNDPSR